MACRGEAPLWEHSRQSVLNPLRLAALKRKILGTLQRMETRRETVSEGHARSQLKVGGLRVEELFGKSAFGPRPNPKKRGGVVSRNHGATLEGMLKNDVL